MVRQINERKNTPMKEEKTKNYTDVRFNDPEEFLCELAMNPPNLEQLVRATKLFEQTNQFPIRHLSVIATYMLLRGSGLFRVSLRRYCGQIWEHSPDENQKIYDKADEILRRIDEAAAKLHLETRAGIYE